MQSKKILFLCRNDGSDVRIRKEVSSLLSQGFKIKIYLLSGKKFINEGNKNLKIIRLKKSLFNYPGGKIFFILFLNFISIFDLIFGKFHSVHAVNEEMFLSIIFSKVFRKRTVLDLFDSVQLKFNNLSFIIFSLLNTCSFLSKLFADVIIVTDSSRKNLISKKFANKILILPNYPSFSDLPNYTETHKDIPNKKRFLLSGSISKGRGLQTILDALSYDLNEEIEIICVGWIYDRDAEDFIKHRSVNYQGILEPKKVNELLYDVDASITLYEPSNLNNIYASPNKVYDSLCNSCNIIINSEVKMTKWLRDIDLVYLTKYKDSKNLFRLFNEVTNKSSVENIKHFRKNYVWENVEKNLSLAHQEK